VQLVTQVCSKDPEERMDRELEPLMRILEKIEFTASLEASIQRELARYMRFLSVPPGTVIFSQGDLGDLFYIILSGDAYHFQTHTEGSRVEKVGECL
jgi:CRP-like cAMP-binding protein